MLKKTKFEVSRTYFHKIFEKKKKKEKKKQKKKKHMYAILNTTVMSY